MIKQSDIRPIGKFMKSHGVNGEISFFKDSDSIDLQDFSCIITDIDGIYVPFFITSVRPKSIDTDLVKIDGISNEINATLLTNKTAYVLNTELFDNDEELDVDGFYAEDFIGYVIKSENCEIIGEIVGVDDTTDNFLFIVKTEDDNRLLIPVADEFIMNFDTESHEITMSLPNGLIDLQSE